jgi:hypothetical protein
MDAVELFRFFFYKHEDIFDYNRIIEREEKHVEKVTKCGTRNFVK